MSLLIAVLVSVLIIIVVIFIAIQITKGLLRPILQIGNATKKMAEGDLESMKSSKNTATLIEVTIRAVQSGRSIAVETVASFDRIVDSSNKVTSLIYQISDATQEQASSVAQVTQGINQISSVV